LDGAGDDGEEDDEEDDEESDEDEDESPEEELEAAGSFFAVDAAFEDLRLSFL
jgi:hypothetical protein